MDGKVLKRDIFILMSVSLWRDICHGEYCLETESERIPKMFLDAIETVEGI